MTQERITPNYEVLPAFYHQLQTHPLYIDLTPSLESASPPRETLEPQNLFPRNYRWHRECRRGLDLALKKLSENELAGKDHIESYLRDQYRRNLRPSTLANSLRGIESFMFFIQRRGKIYIEEITRQDIEGWIEHEQDRGMKASTVDMRLGTLKAFLRFLIEREVLPPELLNKRMTIKVPDALPRAMDPDDVRQLVAVLDDVRNRAMILVLLRTGMRVGELLNTIVEDVNLKERRIEIYEAGKTRVGRVVYLSDDALKALKDWLKVREPHKTYLFYSQGKHRYSISYPAVRAMFVKCLEKADLEMTRRYARLTDRTREEEYFRAMAIIERGEINGHYQLDCELSAFFEKTQLLCSHDQELHEHS
ncbi:MAG: tyrosine-type recombinase/integrase [Deltaproteobacteria bacterium]|nr:tyrosine-type recombinase/integrase [Deltaproteobacteria bacterium]